MADDAPRADAMTIVIHLPQTLEAVARLLAVVGELWPDAACTDGLARIEVAADG